MGGTWGRVRVCANVKASVCIAHEHEDTVVRRGGEPCMHGKIAHLDRERKLECARWHSQVDDIGSMRYIRTGAESGRRKEHCLRMVVGLPEKRLGAANSNDDKTTHGPYLPLREGPSSSIM
jgi:hypothetical protein